MNKFLRIAVIATAAVAIYGCAATSSDTGKENNPLSAIPDSEPILQKTVVAQSLESWPYSRNELTYVLKNKNVVATDKDLTEWTNIVKESVNSSLKGLGLKEATGTAKGKLTVIYGIVPMSTKKENADAMFDSIGLTTGSTADGMDTAIDLSIVDNSTGVSIWSGAVSASADRKLTSTAQKQSVVNILIKSIMKKLPAAK